MPLLCVLAYCSTQIGPTVSDEKKAGSEASGPQPGLLVSPPPGAGMGAGATPQGPATAPVAAENPATAGAKPAPQATGPMYGMGPSWYVLDGGLRISVPGARVDSGQLVIRVKLWNDSDTQFRLAGMHMETPRIKGGSHTCRPITDKPGTQITIAARSTGDVDYLCPEAPQATVQVTIGSYGERTDLTFIGSVGADPGSVGLPSPGATVAGPPTSGASSAGSSSPSSSAGPSSSGSAPPSP